MDTVNNVVNAASKAIWGEQPAENQAATSTTATTGATSTTSTASTAPHENVGQEPLSGQTGNTSAGEPYDKGNEVPFSTYKSSQQQSAVGTETDPLGHTNKEAEVGGPSSTAHSNVKEPGFTQTSERSEEMGARDDIKGSVGEDRSRAVGTGQVSTSDGPVSRVGEGIDARSEKPEESGNPPAATSKNKNTNDETTDVAVGQTHGPGKGAKDDSDLSSHQTTEGKGADKVSVLKTGQHPYGEANVPEIIAKDLKDGQHPSEKLTGHPEGKGDKYATFTDPEAASHASGADVEKMAKTGKVDSGASGETGEDGSKEKLSMKDKIKAKLHRH